MAKPLPKASHPELRVPVERAPRNTVRAPGEHIVVLPPAGGVSPRVVALAASMVIVFLLATTLFMTGNPATDLNLLGVAGFAVIFFSLTLGLSARAARDRRWAGPAERRGGSLDDQVAIATGTISSRAAMVQILVLPVTLAAGMAVIALIFAMGL